MDKKFLFMFMFVLLLGFASAESIGTFEINEEMQITNYCETGVCTFITLESLEYPNGTIVYPNASMTKNGQAYNYSFTPTTLGTHTFVTCGDSTSAVCDKDTFFVNFNGETDSTAIMIILLLFFIGLFIGYHYLNKNINYDRWYDKILKKYENRNYVKLVLSAVGYNLIKNKFSNYYLIGFPIILILTDMVMTYSISSLSLLFEYTTFVYSLGISLVAFMFFGQGQEMIVRLIKDATDNSWGVGDDK